jgi:hypothetical protein
MLREAHGETIMMGDSALADSGTSNKIEDQRMRMG